MCKRCVCVHCQACTTATATLPALTPASRDGRHALTACDGGMDALLPPPPASIPLPSLSFPSSKQQHPNKANHPIQDSQRIYRHSPDHHGASFCPAFAIAHQPSVADPDLSLRNPSGTYLAALRRHRASHSHDSTLDPFDRLCAYAHNHRHFSPISLPLHSCIIIIHVLRDKSASQYHGLTFLSFSRRFRSAPITPTGKHGYHGSCCS